MHELQLQREKNAEAQRAAKAAEEALRLEKRREREAQVRQRQLEMKEEKKVALDVRMAKAEVSREAHIGKVASRARQESRKVDEVTFMKSIRSQGAEVSAAEYEKEDRKAQIALKLETAEERRKSLQEEKVAAKAEREKAASERLMLLQLEDEAKERRFTHKVDEAYERWSCFTQAVADRAVAAAKARTEVMVRREMAEAEEAMEKRRALEQRIAEANERRLAHIHELMRNARVASERQAQAQQTREARRATFEEANSTTDGVSTSDRRSVRSDNDCSAETLRRDSGDGSQWAVSAREGGSRGGHAKSAKRSGSRHGSRRTHHRNLSTASGCSESGHSISGDESASRGLRSSPRNSAGGEGTEGGDGPGGEGAEGVDEDVEMGGAMAEEISTSGTLEEGEGMADEAGAATVAVVPPTLAALAAKADVDDQSNLATSGGGDTVGSAGGGGTGSAPISQQLTSPLRAQVEAARAAKLEAQKERLRKLRGAPRRAKGASSNASHAAHEHAH